MKRRRFLQTIAAAPAVSPPTSSILLAQRPPIPANPPSQPVFALVHPAWHGSWVWKKITPLLRAGGRDVYIPTLTGLGERSHLAHPMVGLETHVQDVVNVLEYEDLRKVILVGHSNAGTLITGVADRAPERLSRLVYLDAFAPEDGQATIDLLPPDRRREMEALVRTEGNGWLLPRLLPIPWDRIVRDVWRVTDEADLRWLLARLCPTPFKTFTEPVRRRNTAAEKLPRTYIRCLQYKSSVFDRHAEMARRSAGWRYRELASFHHPAVTTPHELANLLLEEGNDKP
jgi:pimeloyl-ACP methyl ester carboxylesterase